MTAQLPESSQIFVTHGYQPAGGDPADRVIITKSALYHLLDAAGAGDDMWAWYIAELLEPEMQRLLAGYGELHLDHDCCGYLDNTPYCVKGEHSPWP